SSAERTRARTEHRPTLEWPRRLRRAGEPVARARRPPRWLAPTSRTHPIPPHGLWRASLRARRGAGGFPRSPALPFFFFLPSAAPGFPGGFRERVAGGPRLFRLMGEPSAEQAPLLFWIARALTWLSIPLGAALRVVPAVASALTVLVVARLGSRLAAPLAGWV